MSKCTRRNNDFIETLRSAIKNEFNFREVKVYYDASVYSKRDYSADLTLPSNSNWCSEDTQYLKEVMRKYGATNILCVKRKAIARTYLDLAFDIKVSLLNKEVY